MTLASAALFDYHELVAAAGGAVRRGPSAVWADAGSSDPFLNTVSPAVAGVDISDEDAEWAWAACEQSPSRFMWWTPHDERWVRFARERGMVSDGPVTLMEAEIGDRGDSRAAGIAVVGPDELEAFFTVAEEYFDGGGTDALELAGRFGPLVAAGRVVLLWARDEGEVHGTLLVHLGEEDPARAGIYWVSVKPAARQRGVATALCEEALSIAARRGRTLAVLQSSALGRGVYERLGFRAVGELESWVQPQ
jgi:ribosomal protein S18 acetylase RimI-like enzyme